MRAAELRGESGSLASTPGGAPTTKPLLSACRAEDPSGCAQQCDGGDAESCNSLGKLYRRGERVEKDLGRAFELFKRSCDRGGTKGCVNLGSAYSSGEGVIKDDARAVTLFKDACDAHDDVGCTSLGNRYRDGRGVQQSYGRAIELFTQACGRGHGRACLNLGLLHDHGDGVLRSASQAAAFYDRACNAGEPIGCRELGVAYEQGEGVTKDLPRSAVLYQQACNAHDEDGCAYLGASYRDGRGVPEDKDKGAQLLANACDAGSAEGCKFLGFAYREGIGLPPDAARATTAFETSCKLGDSAACGFAASGQKDPSRAIALLTQACDGGDAFFCQTLGARYLTGDGVSADRNRAVELLKRACASSDKDFDRKAACDFAGDLEDTRSRSTPMTSQVAGFRFGMTLNEFTATCTRSAHHITESTPAGTFCDGAAAGVGFDVESTGATFCEGKICSFIVVRSTPRGETEPERERVYDDLGARLSSRYGDAKKRVPDEGVTRTAWGWSVADSALQSDLILLMTHEKKGYELVILYRNRAAIVRDAATRHHQDTNL